MLDMGYIGGQMIVGQSSGQLTPVKVSLGKCDQNQAGLWDYLLWTIWAGMLYGRLQ